MKILTATRQLGMMPNSADASRGPGTVVIRIKQATNFQL